MARTPERRQTFSRLMDEHALGLRRLAGAYLSDPAAREDLFQEIAVAAWTSFRGSAGDRRPILYATPLILIRLFLAAEKWRVFATSAHCTLDEWLRLSETSFTIRCPAPAGTGESVPPLR